MEYEGEFYDDGTDAVEEGTHAVEEATYFDSGLTPPAKHKPSMDSLLDYKPIQPTDYPMLDNLFQSIIDTNYAIRKKIQALENADISVQIVSYKIFEATHEFKTRIGQVKDERNKILVSVENKSELSLILNDLDKKISDLERELDLKIRLFNQEKLELQERAEDLIIQLDDDTNLMKDQLNEVKLDVQKGTSYKTQVLLLNQKHAQLYEELQENLVKYEKLQLSGWRVEHSEVKLSELLEEHGLKFTPSGRLLTRGGSLLTFQEAQEKGYFREISHSLYRISEFFRERDGQQSAFDQIGAPDTPGYSEGSTVDSKMSSEEVHYLKQHVGKPLTLALAEIVAKQPRDPIHYLGHYLFKYRYNQELEELRKREVEELTKERKILSQERWKKFIEEEARNAVIEMIIRAEKIAIENELKRIERDQMLAAEEEEGGEEEEADDQETKRLLDEARDKFE